MSQSFEIDRRSLLRAATLGSFAMLPGCSRQKSGPTPVSTGDLHSSRDLRPLAQYPQKAPLILLTDRPPQLETPLHYFNEDLTPNEAHFVRWHLSGIPEAVDSDKWRLEVQGNVKGALSLTLDNLQKNFQPVSLVALNQCSGNSRSLFEPRVPGGQWGNGAMSNARWTGARLKDILGRAGLRPGTVEISFSGLDKPALAATPDFQKALSADVANNPDVLVAYAMNGKPLPMLNGFPARLIVPGWYATYWVKALSRITANNAHEPNFWMDKAYRIPNNRWAEESPDHLDTDTVPIGKMAVHSIFVAPEPGATVPAGKSVDVSGLATHGGEGIHRVELSADGGQTWSDAKLDPDLGRYSWRRWRASWTPANKATYRLMVRATDGAGTAQPTAQWNHSGYQRSAIEHLDVQAV
jgi:sulfite dehydrogenase (cytochrome) subunit A